LQRRDGFLLSPWEYCSTSHSSESHFCEELDARCHAELGGIYLPDCSLISSLRIASFMAAILASATAVCQCVRVFFQHMLVEPFLRKAIQSLTTAAGVTAGLMTFASLSTFLFYIFQNRSLLSSEGSFGFSFYVLFPSFFCHAVFLRRAIPRAFCGRSLICTDAVHCKKAKAEPEPEPDLTDSVSNVSSNHAEYT